MKETAIYKEIKAILTNRKQLVPIMAIIIIPVLYAAMFLWAFWDPYDQMDDLPIAIVNADEGAFYEEQHLELGNELVKKLKDEPEFDFHFIDEEEKALQDLNNQKYYIVIKIPDDFSNNATTLLDDTPEKLDLIYIPNESFNFLSAQIGETAMLQIQAALEESIIETYAETMFDKVGEMSDGFATASDGAGKLHDGSYKLNDGAIDLQTGTHSLLDGSLELKENLQLLAGKSVEFNTGVGDLKDGSTELASGLGDLTDGVDQLKTGQGQLLSGAESAQAGTEELVVGATQTKNGLKEVNDSVGQLLEGTGKVKTGADTLSSSLTEWQKGAEQTSIGAAEVNQGIINMEQQIQQLLSSSPDLPDEMKTQLETALKQLNDGSKQVADGTNQLSTSAEELKGGAATLAAGVGELNSNQQSLKTGVNQLYEGSIALEAGSTKLADGQKQITSSVALFGDKLTDAKSGANQLAAGANKLATGTEQLAEGSTALIAGTNELADGSGKLADGTTIIANGVSALTDGTEELLDGSNELSVKLADAAKESSSVQANEDTYNMMANPVEVKNEKINEVPNYGTGFAPYFLSLGLFVGALLLSIVYPLREPVGTPKSGLHWFTSKFIILFGIGILQALVAVGILMLTLGLEAQSVPLFILYAIITSLTFITLIQFFVTAFGDPGRFVAILILIMQLTTSAGTFPLELIPKSLQFFNAFLPMTYTVAGFKAVISSGDYSAMWQNAGILMIFTSLFILGTITYFILIFKRKYANHINDKDEVII